MLGVIALAGEKRLTIMQQEIRIVSFSALAFLLLFSTITVFSCVYASAAKGEYSKEMDAGREILVVSPSGFVRLEKPGYLEFRIIVFDPSIARVTVIVCGKAYSAEPVKEKHGPPRVFVARVPIKYTDIYSWKIRIIYKDHRVKETCMSRTIVEVVGEENRGESTTLATKPMHSRIAEPPGLIQWHKPVLE